MSKVHVPIDTEIETYTGDYLDFSNPSAKNIHFEDIAEALGNTCRFSGHVKKYYSVAEHAVIATQYAQWNRWSVEKQLAVLHHDDAEAYLGDIVRPFKHLLGDALEETESKIDKAICEALNLPFGPEALHSDHVKEADNWALRLEAKKLLPSQGREWGKQKHNNWGEADIEGPIILDLGLLPREAKRTYWHLHERLMDGDRD